MATMRHWKEKFDPQAALVWNKPMLFLGQRVKPGDKVTAQQRALLPRNRLRIWWKAQMVRLDPDAPQPERKPKDAVRLKGRGGRKAKQPAA